MVEQDPNEELGADPEALYAGVRVVRPEDAVSVSFNGGDTHLVDEHPLAYYFGRDVKEGIVSYYRAASSIDGEGNLPLNDERVEYDRTITWYDDNDEVILHEAFTVVVNTLPVED